MELCKYVLFFLLLNVGFPHFQCRETLNLEEGIPGCGDADQSAPIQEVEYTLADFYYTSNFEEKIRQSRVQLPDPCAEIEAYSGFVNVDSWASRQDNSFLFFLYIKKSKKGGSRKRRPLLLWLQGGPGKSSLFGQFLENGPLGIDATGSLFYRNHTLLNQADLIYLDQPVGSGYSFEREQKFRGTLKEASEHITRFLHRFNLIFPESRGRDLFIGGESYGARFAIGAASEILTGIPVRPNLHLKGVMLGVGLLFPLLDLIDSTDYLYYTGLLDENGKAQFTERFRIIRDLAGKGNYTAAAHLLSQTVLNLRTPGQHSLFQMLTGFLNHGSITTPERSKESLAYYAYANSTKFKKIIHIGRSRVLDGGRPHVASALAMGDFFVDQEPVLRHVLNSRHAMMYTAQLDDVFPAINIERELKKFEWRGSKHFRKAKRILWYQKNNSSLGLLGYRKKAGGLLFANVLFAGHHVFLDRSCAVSELYRRFFSFQKTPLPESTVSSS
uniref:Carboxypeptidase n=1 Tax=Amblyomma maculatum TaxID=34609 RepID=G3MQB9_AMBMU